MIEQGGLDIRNAITLNQAEISDCVTYAAKSLEKLRKLGRDGKIIFVNAKNHAYLVPNDFDSDDEVINAPVKVEVFGEVSYIEYPNMTKQELLDMVDTGEADDIT